MGQAAADDPQPLPLRNHGADQESELPGRQAAAAAEQVCQAAAAQKAAPDKAPPKKPPGPVEKGPTGRRDVAERTGFPR